MQADVLLGFPEKLDHLRLRQPDSFTFKTNIGGNRAIGRLVDRNRGLGLVRVCMIGLS
jgi:hypothetical protein